MTVSTIATPYLDVCIEYCGQEGANEEKTMCINEINQKEFENCVSISKPENCIGYSMPVAVLDTTYYYPNAAGTGSCVYKEC